MHILSGMLLVLLIAASVWGCAGWALLHRERRRTERMRARLVELDSRLQWWEEWLSAKYRTRPNEDTAVRLCLIGDDRAEAQRGDE